MDNQHYHHEMLAAEHFSDLRRDIERERILAQLPQRLSVWRRGIGRVGRLLVVVGTRMEGVTQSDQQLVYKG